MTIHFIASGPDVFYGQHTVDSSGTYHNDDKVRAAAILGPTQRAGFVLPSAVGANSSNGVWVHCRLKQPSISNITTSNFEIITARDVSNNLAFRLKGINPGGSGGSAFVFTVYGSGSQEASTANILHSPGTNPARNDDIDVWLRTSGGLATLSMYYGGVVITADIATTAGTNRAIKSIAFGCLSDTGTGKTGWSEIIVADTDTRNLRVEEYYPSADGSYTDGTGTYANVDEIADDTDSIVLAAVADKNSVAVTKHATGNSPILAVAITGKMAADGSGDLQAGMRIAETDYYSTDLSVPGSPSSISAVFETSPATSLPWGTTDLTDIEFIVKAVA